MDLDPTFLTWTFVVGGLLLMVLETVVPGGVAGFLGLGGLVIAGLRALGLLVDPGFELGGRLRRQRFSHEIEKRRLRHFPEGRNPV